MQTWRKSIHTDRGHRITFPIPSHEKPGKSKKKPKRIHRTVQHQTIYSRENQQQTRQAQREINKNHAQFQLRWMQNWERIVLSMSCAECACVCFTRVVVDSDWQLLVLWLPNIHWFLWYFKCPVCGCNRNVERGPELNFNCSAGSINCFVHSITHSWMWMIPPKQPHKTRFYYTKTHKCFVHFISTKSPQFNLASCTHNMN